MLILIPFIMGGNPTTDFHVDRAIGDLVSGDVVLDRVKYSACTGQTSSTVTVQKTVDIVAGVRVAAPAGDWCSMTLFWEGSMTLDGPNYVLGYDKLYTTLAINANGTVTPTDLAQYTVLSGQFSGGAAKLYATIN